MQENHQRQASLASSGEVGKPHSFLIQALLDGLLDGRMRHKVSTSPEPLHQPKAPRTTDQLKLPFAGASRSLAHCIGHRNRPCTYATVFAFIPVHQKM